MTYNWIKLPTGLVVNMNLVETLDIIKITNPKDSFQVVAVSGGHRHVLAEGLYQYEKAAQVRDAVLYCAGIKPIEVEADMREKTRNQDDIPRRPAGVPPELNLH